MYFQSKKLAIIVLFLIPVNTLQAQSYSINTITTAIPFLTINPNAQAGGMGDIGVVSSSLYYESGLTQNPALLSRNNMSAGTKISYTPWMRRLVPDIYILDFAGYYSIDSMNTIAGSFRFFRLGEIIFTDTMGNVRSANPYEYYFSIRYARTLTKNFSAGVGIKYIFSDLASGFNMENYKPIHTYAIDFGLDYRNNFKVSEKSSLRLDFGLAFLNLGPKVTYFPSNDAKSFIPAEIKIGTMLTYKHILNH